MYRIRACLAVAAFCLSRPGPLVAQEAPGAEEPADAEFRQCAAEPSPEVRLACFDALAADRGIPVARAAPEPDEGRPPVVSRVSRRWELEEITQRGRFALVVHQPNYFLGGTWNFSPNQRPFDTGYLRVRNEEVKLQLSFKLKLAEGLIGDNGDLWATYTQRSWWLAYAHSSPFRDTNYEPSLLFTWRTNVGLGGGRVRMLALELNHSSNGQGEAGALSRSWNRLIGKVVYEHGDLVAEARAWWRIPEPSSSDNNPDITRYMGNGSLLLTWARGRHTLSAQLRSNLSLGSHRGAAELSWSFPLHFAQNLRGYAQYFYGYGESLIDYNHAINRVGIGLSFSDWY